MCSYDGVAGDLSDAVALCLVSEGVSTKLMNEAEGVGA
jgi:hypothetical protein